MKKFVALPAIAFVLIFLAGCADTPEKTSDEPNEQPPGALDPNKDLLVSPSENVRADSTPSVQVDETIVSDADRRFLREMLDHHEGLIQLSHEAMQRFMTGPSKDRLSRFDIAQDREKQQMAEALGEIFKDNYSARPDPQHRGEIDSVLAVLPTDRFRDAIAKYIVHHNNEGIRMIDMAMPDLQRQRVRALARAMRAQMAHEIKELSAKTK